MTKCPSCFRTVNPRLVAYVCISGRCAAKPDADGTSIYGAPRMVTTRTIDFPQPNEKNWRPKPEGSVPCTSCGGPTAESCSVCSYRFPPGWRIGQVTCVALAGARATGKSLYIGVAVPQIAKLCSSLGTSMVPVTEETKVNFREHYQEPLMEARGVLKPTARVESGSFQLEPLIYALGTIKGVPRYLAIRDVAGEDLESGRFDAPHMSFFGHADGVLFLFDPLRVEEIRETLHGVVPAQRLVGGDPIAVLTTVLQIIGSQHPKIGVALSKFDAVQELRNVRSPQWQKVMSNPGAGFLRDPDPTGAQYDVDDGELVHEEIRSLLNLLGAQSLIDALRNPSGRGPVEHRYFAVSALGSPPDGEHVAESGIAPFRVLDPIRWLLSSAGVL